MSSHESVSADLLSIICCPFCKADLSIKGNGQLVCSGCGDVFPIQENILIFVKEHDRTEQTEEYKIRQTAARKHEKARTEDILKVVSRHHCIPVMDRWASQFRQQFHGSQWILDAGCGTGYYWRHSVPGGKLLLMDFVFDNLKVAQSLLRGRQDIFLMQADIMCLPLKVHSFSGLWSVQVFQHFPAGLLQQALKELDRILAEKFRAEIINLNPALFRQCFYRLCGKKYHTRGSLDQMLLNRLGPDEWAQACQTFRPGLRDIRFDYTEIFFHPGVVLPLYPVLLENVFRRWPRLARALGNQIHLKLISS